MASKKALESIIPRYLQLEKSRVEYSSFTLYSFISRHARCSTCPIFLDVFMMRSPQPVRKWSGYGVYTRIRTVWIRTGPERDLLRNRTQISPDRRSRIVPVRRSSVNARRISIRIRTDPVQCKRGLNWSLHLRISLIENQVWKRILYWT